ncbi:MAG: ARMT1-like domain-containing protein [Pseudomonadota bacterium]
MFHGLAGEPVHGDWDQFLEAAAKATEFLCLADNAGEIAVDRLVIEELGAERVTVAVRGAPVLNDATIEDPQQVGLDELVRVIDNGSDAPVTILKDCSSTFRKRFDQADLIIAKGQGNFETLAPDLIVPCHCTGDRALERLRQRFGERVVPGSACAVFSFDVVGEPV